MDLTEKVLFPCYHKSPRTQFFQIEFFKLAVEFEEEGTGTVVKEETSASLKDKVSETMRITFFTGVNHNFFHIKHKQLIAGNSH